MKDTIAAIALLISLAAIIPGIITLVDPKSLKLQSRWYALPMLTAFLVSFAIMFILLPGQGQLEAADFVLAFMSLAIWTGLFHLARKKAGGFVALQAEVSAPDRSPEEVDAIRFAARRAQLEKVEADKILTELREERIAVGELGTDGRLLRELRRFQGGHVDIDEYRQTVLDEIKDIKSAIEDLKEDRDDMDRDDYRDEMDERKADLEQCRTALNRIDDREYKQRIAVDGFAERGKWARFEYVDADGVITTRSISNWERRGPYIAGFDRSKKSERTFRQDRISEWVSG